MTRRVNHSNREHPASQVTGGQAVNRTRPAALSLWFGSSPVFNYRRLKRAAGLVLAWEM